MPYKHDPLTKDEINILNDGSRKERNGVIIGPMFR